MYSYLIFVSAAVMGAAASIMIGVLLARRTSLSLVARSASAVALGLLVVGLYAGGAGYVLYQRIYVPAGGMDEIGAAMVFLVSLIVGSASALFFGVSVGLWERLRKK
ncbi:MAG TPA: hypothetical protein PLM52_04595 [Tabrizicola sp.]|nr:hypothetical protein [Tabrizicola sp.]